MSPNSLLAPAVISSKDQGSGGGEADWSKSNLHMFKLTNWFKKEEKGSVNTVNFLFNPNILVGETIICCLAYVKL